MRKIGWWLLPALFLFVLGCGGGGQTTSGTTTGGGGEPALPAGYGLIKLTIHQGNTGAPTDSHGVLAPNNLLPVADNVRIAARLVATRPVEIFDENGDPFDPRQFVNVTSEVYRKIQDFNLTGSTTLVTMAVPAANGYSVEILSSITGGTDNHIMLKYGKAPDNVDVTAGGSASTTIDATPVAAGLTFGSSGSLDNVIAGSKYSIPVFIDNVPLRKSFYFQQFVDNLANAPPLVPFFVDTTSPFFNFTNPTFTAQTLTTDPGPGYFDLYFQGLFFIDDSWKSDTDKQFDWYKRWKFYYPNPSPGFADSYLTTRLIPLGVVNITINNLSPSK